MASHYYLSLCSERIISASANPGLSPRVTEATINHFQKFLSGGLSLCHLFNYSERITIYRYKSNEEEEEFRGMPVVLNFTKSDCFLRCCKEDQRVFLQAEVSVALVTQRALPLRFHCFLDLAPPAGCRWQEWNTLLPPHACDIVSSPHTVCCRHV